QFEVSRSSYSFISENMNRFSVFLCVVATIAAVSALIIVPVLFALMVPSILLVATVDAIGHFTVMMAIFEVSRSSYSFISENMNRFSVFLCIVATIAGVSATDYCSSSICTNGAKHIACGHSGQFPASCPSNAKMIPITDDLKKILVDTHNEKRNFIAGGGDAKLSPACRMATMEWDDELANLAALNVMQCQMAHDRCRNTDAFKYSGQNLAWFGFTGPVDHAAKLKQSVENWFSEVKDTKQSYIDSYPNGYSGPAIGHFTVMMADRNIRVGCAAVNYTNDGERYLSYLQFSASCPSNAKMIPITDDLKKILVDTHNEKRNFIAGGGVAKLSPACRMATMEWDDELANLAALNVMQCRNTDAFKYSGQNLAWFGLTGPADHAAKLKQSVEIWFSEVKDTKQSHIDSFPDGYSGPDIGHFTVMMADRNIRVGCAAVNYKNDGERYLSYLVACNYATTNMYDLPIYKSCSRAATSCTTGTNPKYPNLCSASEKYAVNKWI
ncbi:hypothetical protein DOY81_010824, partial [Sarcophaga bullata]